MLLERLDAPAGRRVLLALAVLAQLVALYWPRPVEIGSGVSFDKLVHATIFGAVLWTGVRAGLDARWLAPLLVVHAGVSEVVQATLLDRDGSVADAVADVTGLAVAGLALRARRRRPDPAGPDPAGPRATAPAGERG